MDDHGIGVAHLQKFLAENSEHKVYDFSQLEQADQCMRKFQYKYRENVDEGTGVAALFSKHLIHPGIAAVHQGLTLNDTFWTACWKAFRDEDPKYITNKEEQVYQLGHAKRLVTQYRDQFTGDSEVFAYQGTEVLYWRTLPDVDKAVWVCQPDVVVMRRVDDLEIPIEIKNSTWGFNRGLNPMDRQLLSQAWTTKAKLQMKVFLQFVTDTRGAVADYRVTREIKPPDEAMLSEWLEETQVSVEMIQLAEKRGVWPKRAPRSCTDFNRPCLFVDVCQLGEARRILLDTMPKKDSPLDYLGL